ncbi:hypothetical protein HanIR_Chr02g0052951 [Helianthus annuus]|nr:hypothetical protein HanIR_Chr02g0052951 [Helianthus annuus]
MLRNTGGPQLLRRISKRRPKKGVCIEWVLVIYTNEAPVHHTGEVLHFGSSLLTIEGSFPTCILKT